MKYSLVTIRFEKYQPVGKPNYYNDGVKGSVSDYIQDLAENYDDGIYVLMHSMEITEEEFEKINGWVG